MSLDLYPDKILGLKMNAVKTAEWKTKESKSENGIGAATRIAQGVNPFWHWTLAYEQLFNELKDPVSGAPRNSNYTSTELDVLMGFYNKKKGKFRAFLFEDPEDNTVTNQTLQLVTDGTNYFTPLQRMKDGEPEDVTDLNLQGDAHEFIIGGTHNQIFANGVQKSQTYPGNAGNFTIVGPGLAIPGYAFAGLVLNWGAVAPDTPVTANFKFYFRVHFEDDRQDFERFLSGLWTIGGAEAQQGSGLVRLETARATI
jgi:hypothetical protein